MSKNEINNITYFNRFKIELMKKRFSSACRAHCYDLTIFIK